MYHRDWNQFSILARNKKYIFRHLYYIDRDEALLKAMRLIQRELQIQLHIECLYFYMSFSKVPFKCLKLLQLFH